MKEEIEQSRQREREQIQERQKIEQRRQHEREVWSIIEANVTIKSAFVDCGIRFMHLLTSTITLEGNNMKFELSSP